MVILFEDPVECHASYASTSHAVPDPPLETISVFCQIFCRIFVQWVACIWFEKQELHPYDRRVQVEDWLPLFSEDIQAHVALEINIWVVDLLRAFYFWWLVGIILAHVERKVKDAAFVDAFIG